MLARAAVAGEGWERAEGLAGDGDLCIGLFQVRCSPGAVIWESTMD